MKGIVLAGGTGSRLAPITFTLSKQLLPVYDKPMVYYPISTLMLAGIRDILVIATPFDLPRFQALLGDGSNWGVSFSFAEQLAPRGIAEAFLIDEFGKPTSIEEKPTSPKSNLAVPGLYFYDSNVVKFANTIQPSARGELEITSLNLEYLKHDQLRVSVLKRGTAWLDTGTPESLHDAATYVRLIEQRQGLKIGCPEEIAWRKGWISDVELNEIASKNSASSYSLYLRSLLDKRKHEI